MLEQPDSFSQSREKIALSNKMLEHPDYDHLFALKIVGDSRVGKSNLVLRYADDTYTEQYISTIGVDFKIKTIQCLGNTIKLMISDPPHDRFHVADYDDYSHRHGIIIVYDISNQETFNNVEKWLEEIDSLTHKRVSRVLVGNKLDLDTEGKREVSYERAKDFAERKGIDDFIEVSAKDGANVDECFQRMAECILCGLGGNEENQKTDLHIACENGRPDVVSRLLATKADLEARDSTGRTALHIACKNSDKDVVSLLLAKKADLEAMTPNRKTPLHIACENGHEDVIFLLLAKKAKLEATDSNERTPLQIACQSGHKNAVSLLLAKKANLEHTDSTLETPLHIACAKGYKDVVSLLLSNNANLEAMDLNGKTPLHIACEKGRKSVVFLLLAQKTANLEATDSNGKTPLHIACENAHKDILSLLLAKKADLEATDFSGKTPLHIACENAHKDIISLLLSYNANLKAMDLNGKTPLHIVCENKADLDKKNTDIVALLLSNNNANLEVRDSNRKTPLHIACENRHKDIVSLLLSNNADLEATDSDGRTPLHIACRKGHKDIVFLLMDNHADWEAKDSTGKTALRIAYENHHKDVVALLWGTHNASFESKDLDQKKTIDFEKLFEQACQEGKIGVVERILSLYSNDVNIQIDSLEKKTPLHIAAENGDKRLISLLLMNNANVEIMDKYGVKPKDLKIVRDCIEMKNLYGGSLKKFSEDIDKRPNKILNRYHQIQLHLKVPKIQPTPSFRSALTSMVHTQKRLSQPTIGFPLLSENDVEEIIGVCETFLTQKTQVSSQIQQVINVVTPDEALAIACYCWEMPYFIPFRFNEWLLHESEKREKREGMEGMEGYLELLEGGLRKLSNNLKTNVKVEGMEEEVGCIWLGELLFDLKEGEGIVFPFLRRFYQKTRTWKLIKTDHGYIPSTPLHLSSLPSSSSSSSLLKTPANQQHT